MVHNCRLIKLVELEQVMERARSPRSARDTSQRQLYNSITFRFIQLVLYLDVRNGYKTDPEVERICIRFMNLECSKSSLQQSRSLPLSHYIGIVLRNIQYEYEG